MVDCVVSDDGRFMAYVALDKDMPSSAAQVSEIVKRQSQTDPVEVELVGGAAKGTPGSAMLLQVGDTLVTALYVDRPLPPDALQEPLAKNRTFPDAGEALAGHQAHYVVAHLEPVADFIAIRNAASAVTRVCAALCDNSAAAAVVWVTSQALLPAKFVREIADGLVKGKWPLPLWINFLPFGGRKDTSGLPQFGMLTKGLAAFVGREIEFAPSRQPADHIFERTRMLAHYLLENGAVLSDGDTIGLSERERIRVEFADLEGTNLRTFRLTLEPAETT